MRSVYLRWLVMCVVASAISAAALFATVALPGILLAKSSHDPASASLPSVAWAAGQPQHAATAVAISQVVLPTATPQSTPIPDAVSLSPLSASSVAVPAAAENAVVRISILGEFRRLFDTVDSISLGTGSGFLISPDGYIVTNAHVVNGGTQFTISFDADEEGVDATLVGLDECADIAILDIDGAGWPVMQWRGNAVEAGEAVYAVGYPAGVREMQATLGSVRDTNLRAFTDWAAVQQVIDHSAEVQPGNSGGPLLDSAGAVVGVVYARGDSAADAAAIAGGDAQAIVNALLQDEGIFRSGINGQAFAWSGSQYGIWIVSVAPDSAADAAGVLPGDIVRRVDGRQVGRDGTLARYCAMLRDFAQDEVVPIEVWRNETGEILRGELNGAPLLAEARLRSPAYPSPTPAPTPEPPTLVEVVDDSGTLALHVPDDWEYLLSDSVGFGSIVNARIFAAAPDQARYDQGYALINLIVGNNAGLTAERVLDQTRESLFCSSFERSDYADAEWQGLVDRCIGPLDPSYINAFLLLNAEPSLFANINFFVNESDYPITLAEIITPLAGRLVPSLPLADTPGAVVNVDALNVRSGPGLDFAPITQVYTGEVLPIAGKDSDACEWVFVAYSDLSGWVAAAPDYVRLDRTCAELTVLDDAMIEKWRATLP